MKNISFKLTMIMTIISIAESEVKAKTTKRERKEVEKKAVNESSYADDLNFF